MQRRDERRDIRRFAPGRIAAGVGVTAARRAEVEKSKAGGSTPATLAMVRQTRVIRMVVANVAIMFDVTLAIRRTS